MKIYDYFIGIDVGLSGGISVLDDNDELLIYKMPIMKKIVNKKEKNTYNMLEIIKIFKQYKDKNILFCIEKQGVRPGEGSVSAMTIGKGFGQLLGAAYAFEFDVIEVLPTSWKKYYPELSTDGISDKKSIIKQMKDKSKTLKDKALKKANNKEIDKINRAIKSEAKGAAIELVKVLYPQIRDALKHKNSDGVAESVLIAKYGRDKKDELVQKNSKEF